MAEKHLTLAGWKDALTKNKVKDVKLIKDSELQKALALYEKFKEVATSERRDTLDEIISLATPLKKDKAVAAYPGLVKYLGDLLTAATAARVKINKELEKVGMKTADVQIIAVNWDGDPMGGYEALLEFKAPGTPTVALKQEISGGVVSFSKVSLAPSGTLRFMAVSKGKATLLPMGVINYDLSGKAILKFRATQEFSEIKKRAKSAKEATEKSGLKGTAGIEWKIVSVGGEISSESESKNVHEEEVEYVIKVAKATFLMAKL